MKHAAGAVLVLVAGVICGPAVAAAQQPVKAFNQLNTRVSVGDTVWVTDGQGREVEGRILELHDTSITLEGRSQTTLQADDVRRVQRRTKSVGRAALWGLLIGGVAGAVVASAGSSGCTSDCTGGAWAAGFGIFGGIGAGVGAAVRAALPAGRNEVYRASGAWGDGRLSISPVVMPRSKGIVLSVSF